MTDLRYTPLYNRIFFLHVVPEFNSKLIAVTENAHKILFRAVYNFWQALCYIPGNLK
jgi:hypothetical protein